MVTTHLVLFFLDGASSETAAAGWIKPRRVYETRLPPDEAEQRPESRKPRIRVGNRPLSDVDGIIARATEEFEAVPMVGIEGGTDQRRRDDEAIMLIILLAE